jgi:hypothetical protein
MLLSDPHQQQQRNFADLFAVLQLHIASFKDKWQQFSVPEPAAVARRIVFIGGV